MGDEGDIGLVETAAELTGVVGVVLGAFLSTCVGPRKLLAVTYLGLSGVCYWISTWDWPREWDFDDWVGAKVHYHALNSMMKGPQMALLLHGCGLPVEGVHLALFLSLS